MLMILGSLATVTDKINKLVELLSIASPYARASFRAKKHPHVIICGSMTLVSIPLRSRATLLLAVAAAADFHRRV